MKCATHGDVDASGFCRNCGKPLCQECARDVRGALYCEDCLAAALTGSSTSAGSPPRSNPGAAAALGLIPGLGAVYNGDYTRAIILVAIWAALLAVGLTDAFGDLTTLIWIAFGLFPIYTAIDSYRAAQNRQLGTLEGQSVVPVPRQSVGAIVLIALGVLALLGNFGWIRGEWVSRGWPVVLIAIGVWLYVKRSRA
jgi:Domain of unknown function (DUF5668)/B-box zinc finger